MKLFIFEHCPFCAKARMIFGLKNISVEQIVLLNDDEQTPVSMIGKKMVPILQKEDGSFISESMDIVNYIDDNYGNKLITGSVSIEITDWINKVSTYVNKLVIPRYAKCNFKEFKTDAARSYFVNKKQKNMGDFNELLANSFALIQQLEADLIQLARFVQSSNAINGALSTDDINIFPVLRSITVIKGVTLPESIDTYMNNMSQQSQVPLLEKFAC